MAGRRRPSAEGIARKPRLRFRMATTTTRHGSCAMPTSITGRGAPMCEVIVRVGSCTGREKR